ncbi:DUF3168 domain-containing protein [Zavarzinia sp.]|uniref:DUF3168 domain-containing protein n=1 Tax=Zavarzinia sp. TaxID=2027920 RepID=UPI0035630E31
MVPDASLALQQALFARLTADGALTALIGPRLHDRRPEPGGYPQVVIGEADVADDGSATRNGQRHLLTLHVWSRYRGRAEAKQILGLLAAALHRQPPALGSGLACISLRVQSTAVLDEGDGVTSHGVLRLLAVTEPADAP